MAKVGRGQTRSRPVERTEHSSKNRGMPGKNEQVSFAKMIHHRPYRRQAGAAMPRRGKQEIEQAARVSEDARDASLGGNCDESTGVSTT